MALADTDQRGTGFAGGALDLATTTIGALSGGRRSIGATNESKLTGGL